jgi:cytoskeletal protein CcmA (bactofilin family)
MSFPKSKDNEQTENQISRFSPSTAVDAVLGKGSRIIGALSFSGSVDIDAEVEGEIVAKERLTIGECAQLKAKISGVDVIVRGTVQGDITATRSLLLRKPAKVIGNISSPQLSIEDGVIFEGKCSMPTKLDSSKNENFNNSKINEVKVSETKTSNTQTLGLK